MGLERERLFLEGRDVCCREWKVAGDRRPLGLCGVHGRCLGFLDR